MFQKHLFNGSIIENIIIKIIGQTHVKLTYTNF